MKIAFNPSTVAALTSPPNNKDITFDLRGQNIFARGVKFCGTDTNTWRDIKINNVSIGSNILDLRNGSNTTLTNTNGVVTINSTWRPVVDNLTSDSTTSSLSAKQGKVLKALIDGKSNSDHNHDGRYLRLSGQDTMQGNLYLHSHGTSYIGKGLGDKSGADFTEANIVIRSWWGISFKSYDDIVRTYIDTRTGNIGTKGVLNAVGAVIQGRVYNGGDDEGIIINPASNGSAGLILGTHNGERSVFYLKKGNPFWRYNNGSTNLDIYHPKKSGTIALTSDIPNKDSWNYDDRYLKLTGGWMSGDINFGGDNKIYWGRNTDSAYISFKNDGDGDTNSYMSFVTSDNGNEYFRWSHSSSTNTEWMALKSDGLRVRGTKVSLEGHTHDDRYYTKAESNAKYITDITTSVNKLTFTRNGSNIIRDITVNNVQSLGRRNPLTERNAISGIYTYGTYSSTDNLAPTSYFETLGFGEGTLGTIEIGGCWVSGGQLYWRALRSCCEDWFSWKIILDSSNYSGILDSRYYTESEVNSLLNTKLDRVNLTTGSWNPRGYHLAADYNYNGGDLSISESGGQIHVSVNGYFWQNKGQYRVLDTSDVAGLKNDLTIHQYLSNTDTTRWPLIWGGNSHNNASDSTGAVYKSHDVLSWQTSSQTLYATNIQTENIKHLSIGGGIYWNPNVESASDGSDAASITLVKAGVAGGTTLVLSQMNDADDTIQFRTNGSARLYHNSYPILTTQNTYVSNNKGYINGTEITQVNNADKVDNRHAISTTPNTGIIYKAAIYTSSSLTSYWVRLASIPSINQNSEFVATIHVQSGHSNPGRSAILLVYLRGAASSLSKSFKICCNSNYDPNRFRLYYKDSDKTSEIWYQTTGWWDGIITTVISQSSEGALYEGLTLYSGSITAVQTPSMSAYLSAQVSTITDNISGNASTATKLQTPRSIWGQSFDGTGNVDNTLRIRQTTGNYCEGIRIQTADSTQATIILGATADSGTNTNAWSIHRKNDNNFSISRNSADGTNGLVMTSIGMGLGTTDPTQRLDVHGNIKATGRLYLSTNGNYNAILMGDDCWMGDCDISNVIGLSGVKHANAGGIKFGKGGMHIGYDGFNHYASSVSVWRNFNADFLDGFHSSKFPYINSDGIWRIYGNDSVAALADDTEGLSPWAFGESRNPRITYFGILKPTTETCGINENGIIAVFGQGDTHLGIAGDYSIANLQVFGGNADKIVWRKKVAFTSDIPTVTNYYWANVKISASSSTTTSPTVSNLTATRVCAGHNPGIDNSISCSNWFRSSGNTGWYNTTYQGGWYMSDTSWIRAYNGVGIYTSGQIYSSSSIKMGNILLEHTDEINNSANGDIHLNYRNSGNVDLCYGGGNVGIGTNSSTFKLDVNGSAHISSTLNLSRNINFSVVGTIDVASKPIMNINSDGVGFEEGASFLKRINVRIGLTDDYAKEYSTSNHLVIINEFPNNTTFVFKPGWDGQLLFMKLGKKYSGIKVQWTTRDCIVVKGDNFNTLVDRNTTQDMYGDGVSRFFIYEAIYQRWIEFRCG